MEGVDELQPIRKHRPIRRGIVRQARRMSLIKEEIDEGFVGLLGVKKTERRSSFKEEYYIK